MGKARSQPLAVTEINPEHGGRIREPNNNDVLCGRGGRINAHQGNIQYRLFVSEHKHIYLAKTTKKLDKEHIAALVVSKIRQQSPPGRFLKKDETCGLWIEIGDVKAWKKTGQALREDARVLRNKSDLEESLISSSVARSPSVMPTGPLQLEQPYHPIQQLDATMGNHHRFPNIPPQIYRIPNSEGSAALHGRRKSRHRKISQFANQHVYKQRYYANSNPVQVYDSTHTLASEQTSRKLQNVLIPRHVFQQNMHHIDSPSDTNKSQNYRTYESDSTYNASFDSHSLCRMANTIASPKILNNCRKSNKLQPDNNDQNKNFNMQPERREKFQRPIWRNGRSIEFLHLKDGTSKDDSNLTLSLTENEDVTDSTRSRMGKCGSYNETLNSSITSSCFQNSNISNLSTVLGPSGLTSSINFPPSAMSPKKPSFSEIAK